MLQNINGRPVVAREQFGTSAASNRRTHSHLRAAAWREMFGTLASSTVKR